MTPADLADAIVAAIGRAVADGDLDAEQAVQGEDAGGRRGDDALTATGGPHPGPLSASGSG